MQFMLDTQSPLASIYTTSTMEHHHFNQTVTILQQQGHNILNKFDDNDYKQVLRNIKHCILATDLAVFFSNRAKLAELVDKQQFSWQTDDHRLLVEAIAMTASDLCASAKPWDIQAKTVSSLLALAIAEVVAEVVIVVVAALEVAVAAVVARAIAAVVVVAVAAVVVVAVEVVAVVVVAVEVVVVVVIAEVVAVVAGAIAGTVPELL